METDRPRADPQAAKEFAQQVVLVLGVIGGIAFTVLVLILEYPDKFEPKTVSGVVISDPHVFFAFLVVLVGLISVLSIIGSISMAFAGSGFFRRPTALYSVGFVFCFFAVMGVILAIPFLLFSFTPVSARIMLYAGTILFFIFVVALFYDSAKNQKSDNSHDEKAESKDDKPVGTEVGQDGPVPPPTKSKPEPTKREFPAWVDSPKLGYIVFGLVALILLYLLYVRGNTLVWSEIDVLIISYFIADLSIKLLVARVGDRVVLRMAVWFRQLDTIMGHWPAALIGYTLGILIGGSFGVFVLIGQLEVLVRPELIVPFTIVAVLSLFGDFYLYVKY